MFPVHSNVIHSIETSKAIQLLPPTDHYNSKRPQVRTPTHIPSTMPPARPKKDGSASPIEEDRNPDAFKDSNGDKPKRKRQSQVSVVTSIHARHIREPSPSHPFLSLILDSLAMHAGKSRARILALSVKTDVLYLSYSPSSGPERAR